MNNRMRALSVALLTSCILFIAACSGNNEEVADVIATNTMSPTMEPTPTVTPEPTSTPMPYIAPLTGIGLEQEATNRPLAVMINNYSAARPQSGLTQADVIWEILAEGGITRLEAIFQSTTEQTKTLGPIRSNRAYLIDIADSYGAIMAHAGGSPEAYGILQKQGKPYLDEISNAGGYFWRSKDRKAPHNLYSELERLRKAADNKGYNNKLPAAAAYPFSPEGALTGATASSAEDAKKIEITFLGQDYEVEYQYDEATGLYKRFINNEPHIDRNTDEALTATNLVVFETKHTVYDNVGRLTIDLKTGGAAYIFEKGKKISAQWVRAKDGMIRFMKDGQEVPFVPGTTFIHVVPNSPALAEHVTISM
ncbi:DUF3048 domain-containing protein [Paenibacillus sp. HB172176]|uniref:DUF3048 domain-containing protein n=1 Tax=Paenibacillus sp. HB172176 TaxID=2493690 RepID=UPI001F0CE623|nr:DUF3048 domain-containing protein [Paenibacillus sp. HB172176]